MSDNVHHLIIPRRPNEPIDGMLWPFVGRARHRSLFRSTQVYDLSEGLSCCFRQWRATHASPGRLHGYALAFKFTFATRDLDERNWGLGFDRLSSVRQWLHHMFDHTVLVAEDDPELPAFRALAERQLADLRVLPAVGCEAAAKHVYDHVARFVAQESDGRVWLEAVEVREHGGNSAIYDIGDSRYEAGDARAVDAV